MKSKGIAAALAAVMLLSGCAGANDIQNVLSSVSSSGGEDTNKSSQAVQNTSAPTFMAPSFSDIEAAISAGNVSSQETAPAETSSPESSMPVSSPVPHWGESYEEIEDLSGLTDEEILAAHPKIIIPEQTEEPHFDFEHEPPLEVPSSADIRICSLSEALSRFSEIEASVPHGTPEQIVQTLMERNILCFAALQKKCWTCNEDEGIVPITSKYLTDVDQARALFENTYTEYIAEDILFPDEVVGYSKVFQDNAAGELCFDLNNLRENNNDSFKSATYAAVISSTSDEIVFGRYYQSRPNANSTQPNNMLFKAVKEDGKWRLENYITDVAGFSADYTRLIQTGRIGAPELVELAKEQVGNIGGEKYWSWYGFSNRPEWCGVFVSWLYDQAGLNGPFFSAVNSEGMYWYKKNNRWAYRGYPDIAPGDCIFYDWDFDGSANHVGIVIGTDGKYVYTIEGNREDACMTRMIALDDERILGYGLMVWE